MSSDGSASASTIESRSQHSEEVFKGVRLEGVTVDSSEFQDCRFVRCAFVESEVCACRFVDCAFEQCDLSLVGLSMTAFSACRFDDSKIIGVNWTEALWPETRLWVPIGFSRCVISDSTFMGLCLRQIRITDCTAHDVDFREADLTEADFGGTDLSGSLFANTNLSRADLSSARNYRIDPRENVIKGARFSLPEAISLLTGLDIDLVGWEP